MSVVGVGAGIVGASVASTRPRLASREGQLPMTAPHTWASE
ncbi:hypothetical protein ACIBU0_03725 [Streptomyces sp. NPDC049627]